MGRWFAKQGRITGKRLRMRREQLRVSMLQQLEFLPRECSMGRSSR